MNGIDTTKDQFIRELAAARKRIADLEASEAELRRNEARYRTVFETVPRVIGLSAPVRTSAL